MDADELRRLIRQREPENIKLDFKQKLHAIDHLDKKVRAEHWNELIKDILALANGNIGTARQTGYLIIGVADKLNQHGTRDLFDVGDVKLSEKDILNRVNNVCSPGLPTIACDMITLDGKQLLIIKIPPTPYLHETTKPLTVPSQVTYPEHVVFIRRKEDIGLASTAERQAILAEKQGIAPPPKPSTQAKRTPPTKPAKNIPFGWLIILGVLICAGLLSFGVIMNMILSSSPQKIPTQSLDPTAPAQVIIPTPTETLTPKPTDIATQTPTNTAVVPPTNTFTPVVLPTDTPALLPPTPAPPIEGTGDVMTVDNWEVRVERIEFAESVKGITGNVEKAAGQFAIVFLTVTNLGLSNDTFIAYGALEIRDSVGRGYEENHLASAYATNEYNTEAAVVLNPDETGFMLAVFDIPKQSDNYTLAPGNLVGSSTGVISLAIP